MILSDLSENTPQNYVLAVAHGESEPWQFRRIKCDDEGRVILSPESIRAIVEALRP